MKTLKGKKKGFESIGNKKKTQKLKTPLKKNDVLQKRKSRSPKKRNTRKIHSLLRKSKALLKKKAPRGKRDRR